MQLTDLGPIIKEARKRANLSQSELASPQGMSRATISAIESGRCIEIGFSKLSSLLAVLGLEITVAPRRGRPTIDELRDDLRKERRERLRRDA